MSATHYARFTSLLCLAPLCLAACGKGDPSSQQVQRSVEEMQQIQEYMYTTPMMNPGVSDPTTQSANDAAIDGSETVIGVTVNGQSRAYLLSAFTGLFAEKSDAEAATQAASHVVNDLVANQPISVAFCDQTNVARVFTRDGEAAIPLWVQGFVDGQMSLQCDGQTFALDSDKTPLSDHPFERTTWDEWKKAHPDTDIYIGT